MNPTERKQRIQQAPEFIKEYLGSPEAGATQWTVFKKHNLPEDSYPNFVHTISDVILGLHAVSELPKLFVDRLEIDAGTAKEITSDLIEFLTPVMNHYEGKDAVTKAEMGKLADQFASRSKRPATPIDESIHTESDATAAAARKLTAQSADQSPVIRNAPVPETNPDEEPVVTATPQDDVLDANPKSTFSSVYTGDDTPPPPPQSQTQ